MPDERSCTREILPQTPLDRTYQKALDDAGKTMRRAYAPKVATTQTKSSSPQHVDAYSEIDYAASRRRLRGEDSAEVFRAEMKRSREWWKRK
jgi:hypothetical protein